MTLFSPELPDRFLGCLLGLAIGDALGGLFEGQSYEHLNRRFDSIESLFAYPEHRLWYTDDTQMTIGVCERNPASWTCSHLAPRDASRAQRGWAGAAVDFVAPAATPRG